MKNILVASALVLPLLLAGCGGNTSSPSLSPTPTLSTPTPTEIKDPLVELLSEPTPVSAYVLEKSSFLAKAKEKNGILIDLRMPQEIAKVPMIDPSAKNLDYYNDRAVSDFFRTADKKATYFLYDSNGSLSEVVYKALTSTTMNIPNVYILKGGIGQ